VPGAEDGLSRRCCQNLPTIAPEKVSQDEFLCTSAEARENIAQYATHGIIDLTRLRKPEYLERWDKVEPALEGVAGSGV
jgi:hypothetical protein